MVATVTQISIYRGKNVILTSVRTLFVSLGDSSYITKTCWGGLTKHSSYRVWLCVLLPHVNLYKVNPPAYLSPTSFSIRTLFSRRMCTTRKCVCKQIYYSLPMSTSMQPFFVCVGPGIDKHWLVYMHFTFTFILSFFLFYILPFYIEVFLYSF